MEKKNARAVGDPAQHIIQHLSKATSSGHRPDDVFMHWLELVEACLDALPAHARAVIATGHMADDTPATAALFATLRERYPNPHHWDSFAKAMAVLIESADRADPQDVLGEIYMQFGSPNTWAGQFFTPMSVAKMMALMTLDETEKEIHARIKAALHDSPIAQAAVLLGPVIEDPTEAQAWFLQRVLMPLLPHIEPITVSDPCCGSGVMFLAAASCVPEWMTAYGLLRFDGIDIDAGCVRMARLNLKLYGLHGQVVRGNALTMQFAPLPSATHPATAEPTEAETSPPARARARQHPRPRHSAPVPETQTKLF